MSDAAPGPDPIYKRLYAFPAMVEDLLRSLVQEEWIERVDFQTLQSCPAITSEGMSDPERLVEVGEAIVRCETGSELLRRLDAP